MTKKQILDEIDKRMKDATSEMLHSYNVMVANLFDNNKYKEASDKYNKLSAKVETLREIRAMFAEVEK